MAKNLSMILLLVVLSNILFAQPINDCVKALEESNSLLEKSYNVISKLEEENKELKRKNDELEKLNIENKKELERLIKENEDLKVLLYKANTTIAESNVMLEKAYKRIDDDQKEIERLRQHINDLIKSGVEIKTHTYEVAITGGYPANIGIQGGFNFPFFPKLGIISGLSFLINDFKPLIYCGLKLNLY